MEEVNDKLKMKADKIQRLLKVRLTRHLNIRVEKEKLREHWSFQWARKNMHAMAGYMAIYDMTKNDIITLDENATLLKTSDNFLSIENTPNKHGAYLYWDVNDEKYVRSGKTTGNPFSKRHEAHEAKAAARFCTGRFYRRYPSKPSVRSNANASVAGRRGHFESLMMLSALAFEIGNSEATKRFESIFIFDDNDKMHINKMNKRGNNTWQAKCNDMVSYLAELAFDLFISVNDNVSDNPGFESCHGVW